MEYAVQIKKEIHVKRYLIVPLLLFAALATGQTVEENTQRIDSLEAVVGNPLCGNGVLNPGALEECDDGNILDGDGCSAACTVEAGCQLTQDDCPDGPLDPVACACDACPVGTSWDGGACVDDPPPPPPSGLLEDGTWTAIPHSDMRTGGPSYAALVDPASCGAAGGHWTGTSCQLYDPLVDDLWDGNGAPNSFEDIQDGWSGGVCIGDEIVVMGGGHGDGAHNGVFAGNVLTGDWRRVTVPSEIWQSSDCPGGICTNVPNDPDGTCARLSCAVAKDGAPNARHTYYRLATDGAYLYVFGGSIWGAGNKGEAPHFFRLDPSDPNPMWEVLPQVFEPSKPHGSFLFVATDGKFYQASAPRQALRWDLTTGAWENGSFSGGAAFSVSDKVGVIYAPPADAFFAFGNGTAWSLPRASWPSGTQTALAPSEWSDAVQPGLTYYPPEERVLVWNGGPRIGALDSVNRTWSEIVPAGDPGPVHKNGTYGRFAYCGERVVLVNGVDNPMYYVDVPMPEEEPEPPPPPPDPPPGMAAAPYYAEPPLGIVEEQCGPESEWDVVDITTDEQLLSFQASRDQRVLVRVHEKATPYPGPVKVKGAKCAKVVGVGGLPVLSAVNGTKAFKGSFTEGGLVVENLILDPILSGGSSGGECIGVPGDRMFVIVRDVDARNCGHHSILVPHAHQLYVEIGRSHFSRGGTHNLYINHVAMAWIYDVTSEDPGWGHALRCIALRCIIERTKVSNVLLDGTFTLKPNGERRIGMHPFEVYTCGENDVDEVEATIYVDLKKNIGVGANFREREGFNTCDVGEVRHGEWTSLPWTSPEFHREARWATVTPLVTTVKNFTVHCFGDIEHCRDWNIGTSYPWADDPQKSELQKFLKAEAFPTWDAFVARLDEDSTLPWWWSWLAEHTLPRHRSSFLKGTITNKVPLPAPLPGWFQRARIVFDRPPKLREYSERVTYCLGVPYEGAGGSEYCVDGDTGRSFDRAIVEVI